MYGRTLILAVAVCTLAGAVSFGAPDELREEINVYGQLEDSALRRVIDRCLTGDMSAKQCADYFAFPAAHPDETISLISQGLRELAGTPPNLPSLLYSGLDDRGEYRPVPMLNWRLRFAALEQCGSIVPRKSTINRWEYELRGVARDLLPHAIAKGTVNVNDIGRASSDLAKAISSGSSSSGGSLIGSDESEFGGLERTGADRGGRSGGTDSADFDRFKEALPKGGSLYDSSVLQMMSRARSVAQEVAACYPGYSTVRLLTGEDYRYMYRYPSVLRVIDDLNNAGRLDEGRANELLSALSEDLGALQVGGKPVFVASGTKISLENLPQVRETISNLRWTGWLAAETASEQDYADFMKSSSGSL